MRVLLVVLVGLLLVGCPRSRPTFATLADARAATLAQRDAAKAAREKKDPAAALEAADAAEHALKQAEALGAATPDALPEVRRAAREARQVAQETDERVKLEAQLGGLKARAYREVRGVALTAGFKGLAYAAREADARGLDALPEAVRESAKTAADWAGRKKPDGTPDWKAVAADMDAHAAAPPKEIGVTLALGFFALGKTGLALVETEALDPAAVADPRDRLALQLLRALVKNGNGYRRLALLEVDAALNESGLRRDPDLAKSTGLPVQVTGAEVIGGAHLALGAFYLHEKDYAAADRELALAIQAWPENPAAEFITGERLLASGDRQKAAESLEAAARGQGEDAEWLAAKLSARARAIRDGQADPEDGFVNDPALLAQVALRALWRAAERSDEAAQVKAEVERARAFCAGLLEHLPGMGAEGDGNVAAVGSGS